MHKRSYLRAGLAAILVGGVMLSGCSAKPAASPSTNAWGNSTNPSASAANPSASATPSASAQPAKPMTVESTLDNIAVAGERGAQPTVTIPTPWGISETKVKVLDEGHGPTVKEGGVVYVHYTGVNGRTGKVFDSSFKGGQPIAFGLGQVVSGFAKGLQGQKVGSRVLVAMTGPDGYDKSGGSPQAGIEVGDTLVFVVEILNTQADAAFGDPVPAKEGLPAVSSDATNPHVTVTPGYPAPAETIVQPILAGSTAHKVAATDAVTVRYTGYSAKTGKPLMSNWSSAKPDSGQLSKLIPGWKKGLVGQHVGSRVLLIVPPADGYPQGNATPAIEAGDTLIYVVDIVWSGAAQQQ